MVAACGRRLLCRSPFAAGAGASAGAPFACSLRQPTACKAAATGVSGCRSSQCCNASGIALGSWVAPVAIGGPAPLAFESYRTPRSSTRTLATSAATSSAESESADGVARLRPSLSTIVAARREERRSWAPRGEWNGDGGDEPGEGPPAERRHRSSRGASSNGASWRSSERDDTSRPGGRVLRPRQGPDAREVPDRRPRRDDEARERSRPHREHNTRGTASRTYSGPAVNTPSASRRPAAAAVAAAAAVTAATAAVSTVAAQTPRAATPRQEQAQQRQPQPQSRSQSPPPPPPQQQPQKEASQAAAPARAVTERVALPEGVYPTYVPRNPGIQDGAWNARDADMVRQAQRDATAVAETGRLDPKGLVLLGLDLPALESLAAHYGQPRFRAKQLQDGVLQGAHSVEEISTIPKQWRAQLLADGVRTGRSLLHHWVGDEDGTRKYLLQLHDGRIIETVGIPTEDRLTVCVSSQVGCPMRCTFCATGKGGFARNLAPHEIMDQVLTVQEQFGRRVGNVVFMGMGEPLLNLPTVIRAYHALNKQIGIGGAFITISTVGVPNAIARLASAHLKATLAVSLHAPNQELRESIIPSAKAYPLEALMEDCVEYYRRSGRRVTFEYTLLSGVNDEPSHAAELTALLQRYDLMSHVNIIPWNPVDESEFKRPSRNRVFAFKRAVEAAGLACTVRETRGLEAAAACGQLRNQFQKQPLPQFEVPL